MVCWYGIKILLLQFYIIHTMLHSLIDVSCERVQYLPDAAVGIASNCAVSTDSSALSSSHIMYFFKSKASSISA